MGGSRACPLGAGGGDSALIAVEEGQRDHGPHRDVAEHTTDARQRPVGGEASLREAHVHAHDAAEETEIEAASIRSPVDLCLGNVDAGNCLTHVIPLLGNVRGDLANGDLRPIALNQVFQCVANRHRLRGSQAQDSLQLEGCGVDSCQLEHLFGFEAPHLDIQQVAL